MLLFRTSVLFVVISPKVNYLTNQMSVRACVNIFKTVRLREHWADVDETCHVYSACLGTQLLGSGSLNFGFCTTCGHPNLAQSGEITHHDQAAYYILQQEVQCSSTIFCFHAALRFNLYWFTTG